MKIKIKPLSVNQAWRGRRFKAEIYKEYEEELFLLLPKIKIPQGNLKLKIVFGLSNKASDVDNPVKPFVDILQKKYGFNDKNIYRLDLEKIIVKKGKEYIEFEISEFLR